MFGCGCCDCTSSGCLRLSPASRSLGGVDSLLDRPVGPCSELVYCGTRITLRNVFTDFRKATRSTAQSSGQSCAGCVSLVVPNRVRDRAISLAGLWLAQVICSIFPRVRSVTRSEYLWLVAKKSDIWKARVRRSMYGDASLSSKNKI